MQHLKLAALAATLALPLANASAEQPSPAAVRQAAEKALPLLQKGAAGHMKQKTCFACHNQGVPILAVTTAKRRGFKIEHDDLPAQLNFTSDFLDKNREGYIKGKGQGGQVATAGYALWTLEMGGFKPNAATAAVAEYLLEFQKERDHWRMTSNRPPSETSHFTANYLAIRGLHAFATPEQKERVTKRLDQVKEWLLKTPAKDAEDRAFRLWSLARIAADAKDVQAAADELIKTQHPGGGWAQLDKMEPDAYATGVALVALHEAAKLKTTDPIYARGIDFLLKTQLSDGSWHLRSRSKPFQAYYETGFPHGKDQFISIAASGWAATALVLASPVE